MRYFLLIPIFAVLPFVFLSLVAGFLYQTICGSFVIGRTYPLACHKILSRDKGWKEYPTN